MPLVINNFSFDKSCFCYILMELSNYRLCRSTSTAEFVRACIVTIMATLLTSLYLIGMFVIVTSVKLSLLLFFFKWKQHNNTLMLNTNERLFVHFDRLSNARDLIGAGGWRTNLGYFLDYAFLVQFIILWHFIHELGPFFLYIYR